MLLKSTGGSGSIYILKDSNNLEDLIVISIGKATWAKSSDSLPELYPSRGSIGAADSRLSVPS